ncbi:MAG: class I SAM-dependent methyltransferase [Desulfobacteraceae bacterium]|nr:class I SAM-dependent methyltransferase [Desulfobacteraceae bacterium]
MPKNVYPKRLRLLSQYQYVDVELYDPMRFYYWPIFGSMYRRRVELCLAECKGGKRVLEVGFGSGITFLNLHDIYKEIHGLDLTAKVEDVMAVFKSMGIETYLRNGNVTHMPFTDDYFDSVLSISILEHLKSAQLNQAFQEINRVLKPGGQVVYGVPIERPLMAFMFRLLGYNIREHHFSTEKDVFNTAERFMKKERLVQMKSVIPILGPVYEIGHFVKVC